MFRISNCDEAVLFLRTLSMKLHVVEGDKRSRGKICMKRLAALLCRNIVGCAEESLVIGKTEKPRLLQKSEVS